MLSNQDLDHQLVGQQQLLQAASELAGLGCFRWNISGDQVTWCDALFQIFGLEPGAQELTSDTFWQFVLPEDRAAIQASIKKAVETNGEFQDVKRIKRADGEIRVIESRGRVIANDQGEPIWVVGVCQDVTERERINESLKWQVDGLQLLSELSTDVLSSDISMESLAASFEGIANHLGCEIYNYFDKVGNDLELKLSCGLSPELTKAISRIKLGEYLCGICAAGDGVMYLPYEEMLEHPQAASLLPTRIKSYLGCPIISEGERIGSFSFLSRTRTHFSESEIDFVRTTASLVAALKAKNNFDRDLRQVEERQDMVLHTAKTVIWECDPSVNFTYVSGYCVELLGFPAEAWLEPGFWHSRVHPDDLATAVAYCTSQVKLKRDHRFEYRMVHKDGTVVWIEDSVQVVFENGELVAMRGALIDITMRKRLEQELRQSQKMEAIGRLAGGIAHDFNNALTVISTYAELMVKQLPSPDKNYNYVTAIQEAAERAAGLTNQLLVFSRKSINQPKSLNLNEIVTQSQTLLRRVIGEDIELSTKLSQKIGLIKSDKSHIEQIILNLAINARDAMPTGGTLSLETRDVEVGENSQLDVTPGHYVELIFSDDGCGMSAETIARCFEPFYTTKEVGKGTGLGLSVTYGVVVDSGGNISVESVPNVGATFKILFPVADDRAATSEEIDVTTEQHAATVLLVEDEQAVRRVARMSLESGGFEVIEAGSGPEALAMIEDGDVKIDALVTDLIMPGMNGQSLANELKNRFSNLKVLYISGYGHGELSKTIDDDLEHCFLQKPFTANRLVTALETVMGSVPEKINL